MCEDYVLGFRCFRASNVASSPAVGESAAAINAYRAASQRNPFS